MITIEWPDVAACWPENATLIETLPQESSSSPLTGTGQVLTRMGERWGWSLVFPAATREDRNTLEVLLLRLRGRENLVRMWDFFHEAPVGTVPLVGVTLHSSVSARAEQLSFAGTPNGSTMAAGAWIGVQGQLFRSLSDAVTVSGVMTVQVAHRARRAMPAGSPVTLYRPTARFSRTESRIELPRQPGGVDPAFVVDFQEYIEP